MHHDMYIRAVLPVVDGKGTGIIQMAVPGYDIDQGGHLAMNFERCQATIAHLAGRNARHYICLTTLDEIGLEDTKDIHDLVAQAGMIPHHLPVDDYAKPDAMFLKTWDELSPVLHGCLDRGEGIVVQCLAGYGRSGTIAALLLIERGMAPEMAIETVRAVNTASIESAEQRQFLTTHTARKGQ